MKIHPDELKMVLEDGVNFGNIDIMLNKFIKSHISDPKDAKTLETLIAMHGLEEAAYAAGDSMSNLLYKNKREYYISSLQNLYFNELKEMAGLK